MGTSASERHYEIEAYSWQASDAASGPPGCVDADCGGTTTRPTVLLPSPRGVRREGLVLRSPTRRAKPKPWVSGDMPQVETCKGDRSSVGRGKCTISRNPHAPLAGTRGSNCPKVCARSLAKTRLRGYHRPWRRYARFFGSVYSLAGGAFISSFTCAQDSPRQNGDPGPGRSSYTCK